MTTFKNFKSKELLKKLNGELSGEDRQAIMDLLTKRKVEIPTPEITPEASTPEITPEASTPEITPEAPKSGRYEKRSTSYNQATTTIPHFTGNEEIVAGMEVDIYPTRKDLSSTIKAKIHRIFILNNPPKGNPREEAVLHFMVNGKKKRAYRLLNELNVSPITLTPKETETVVEKETETVS